MPASSAHEPQWQLVIIADGTDPVLVHAISRIALLICNKHAICAGQLKYDSRNTGCQAGYSGPRSCRFSVRAESGDTGLVLEERRVESTLLFTSDLPATAAHRTQLPHLHTPPHQTAMAPQRTM